MEYKDNTKKIAPRFKSRNIGILFCVLFFTVMCVAGYIFFLQKKDMELFTSSEHISVQKADIIFVPEVVVIPKLDTDLYDTKMFQIANIPILEFGTTSSTTILIEKKVGPSLWPVHSEYPNYGALLPFNRIVAYYGNFYAPKMGILGEYDPGVVLAKLATDVKSWEEADPTTPVIPAIHYVAAVAQPDPGKGGKYLYRMPKAQIEKAFSLAQEAGAIVFLDLQIGKSTVVDEVEAVREYLALPSAHLALDPEFSMKGDKNPGTVIGTLDASEINQAIEILAQIVRENKLAPKILVVHRFTKDALTNYKNIVLVPEVQVVIDMDGWGSPETKIVTYQNIIYPEPVQFAGFKLFYKNDLLAPSTRLVTPEEILKLQPQPSYIQYQ